MSLTNPFLDDDYYTGPELDDEMIANAERTLGYRLPERYVQVIQARNGGVPERRCFRMQFPTSWASTHFEIRALLGVGGEWGIDSPGPLGSAYQVKEWGYPDLGVVICHMPSGGHDAVMLDYSLAGPDDEPAVVYVDEERIPRRVADSFGAFWDALVACDEPDLEQ